MVKKINNNIKNEVIGLVVLLKKIDMNQHTKVTYSQSKVLLEENVIEDIWKKTPYIDNPNKMARIFDGYKLTNKGKTM
jgi:predicted transcriptional regulator